MLLSEKGVSVGGEDPPAEMGLFLRRGFPCTGLGDLLEISVYFCLLVISQGGDDTGDH